uniref:Uncharacterized protein n=1 Tax=Romanomermis culicivorax TaxID=13658 RepID=A0A915IHF2_ROMCU
MKHGLSINRLRQPVLVHRYDGVAAVQLCQHGEISIYQQRQNPCFLLSRIVLLAILNKFLSSTFIVSRSLQQVNLDLIGVLHQIDEEKQSLLNKQDWKFQCLDLYGHNAMSFYQNVKVSKQRTTSCNIKKAMIG